MLLTSKNRKDSFPKLNAFFKDANIGMLAVDRNGKITAINPFALNKFGFNELELLYQSIDTLIPSLFLTNSIDLTQISAFKAQNSSNVFDILLNGLKKDGTEFPLKVSLSNYYAKGEQFTIAFIDDCSVNINSKLEILRLNEGLEATIEHRTKNLKNPLQQLEIYRDQLKAASSFHKAILDNAEAMIIATDKNGILKLFNPEASVNLGYTQEEVINIFTPILYHNLAEIEKKRISLLGEFGLFILDDFEVLVENAKRNLHRQEQYTFIAKNGAQIPVLLTISAIRDVVGEITGFMCIAIDISERKKAEEDLYESLKKEKELGEMKSRFVSMASHEFRTPLSTIFSSAYLIEKYISTADQPKRDKHLQRIFSSINILNNVLNDFLSLGKIEEGKILVRVSQFNIEELMISIARDMKNTLKKYQKVKCFHQGDPLVFMDISLLKHIVMNLLSNASKFSFEKSRIEINTLNYGKQLYFSVKDFGMGISIDDQKHLMERFFRGVNASNIQGTGLGLHIVAKYTELMDGKVECKSEIEKGTEFVIVFDKISNI
jgi:PAS domain S-box-containing protein